MGSQDPHVDEELRRIEQIEARMQVNRADIDSLIVKSELADARADVSEAQADEDRGRITQLEAQALVDHELILELQADGLVNREQVEHLEEALSTSRKIGAAIGIVMANRRLDERGAFEVLRKASSLSNRKLRLVAEDVVLTGAVGDLPVV